jgi:hypothetical protein
MTETDDEKSLIIKKIIFLKKKIDKEIGYNYWKKYVTSVFWSQISTPINLTITMLTAITTAQIQSNNLLSESVSSQFAIVSLILATLNTFFRPHTQYATNTEFLSKWTILGLKFENEYYNNRIEGKTLPDYKKRLESLQSIQKEVNDLRQTEGTNTINFLTDFIFLISLKSCLRNKKNWLDRDKAVEDAVAEKTIKNIDKNKKKNNNNSESNKSLDENKVNEINTPKNEIIQSTELTDVTVSISN